MKDKTVYELELHERTWISDPAGGKDVYRVPGGWIYSEWDQETDKPFDSVFVPFDNEFMIV